MTRHDPAKDVPRRERVAATYSAAAARSAFICSRIAAPLSPVISMNLASTSTAAALKQARSSSDNTVMRPDLITIAKGLTSAYAPLSGSIVGERMWDVLMRGTDENGPLGHGWTYSAHPIGAAAGIANLKLIDDMGLIWNAGQTGAYFRKALADAVGDHPNVGEIRGEGMMAAVEFVADRDSRTFFDPAEKIGARVVAALLAEGVIARAMPEGDIAGFAPPLCMTQGEADQVVAALHVALKKVLPGGY